jgi:integrase
MTIEHLTREFLEKYCRERLRPTTQRGYTVNVENHILPELGELDARQLTPEDLDELTVALREKGLSSRSVVYVHATLRKALNYAGLRGYLLGNVYDHWDMPKPQAYPYRTLTEDQISRLLEKANGNTNIHIAIRLALRYGLRRGEILGIIPHLDLDHRQRILHIQRSRTVEAGVDVVTPCKTKQSNRHILLLEEDCAALASGWNNAGYAVPLTPSQLNKRFRAFLMIGGFPEIRFHDLRHSYATLMLKKGINPKIVSSVLGHSGVGITLDIYSHPDVSMQQRCLEVLP